MRHTSVWAPSTLVEDSPTSGVFPEGFHGGNGAVERALRDSPLLSAQLA